MWISLFYRRGKGKISFNKPRPVMTHIFVRVYNVPIPIYYPHLLIELFNFI